MKRPALIFLVTLLVFGGSLATVLHTLQARDFELRGYVNPVVDANLPFRVPRLGVNAELTQYLPAALPRQLDLMRAMQVTWVRQVFPWDQIETEQGQFNWEAWDHIVQAVDGQPSLRLIAVLVNTPAWARTPLAPDSSTAPPADPADFAAFASAFAARYGYAIDFYQIWDEPNLNAAWGGLEPRPVEYLSILSAAYTAIHAADPGALVIAGALAPTIETGPRNISDVLYLRDLYTLGAQPYMDAVAAKPYGFNTSPADRAVDADVLNFSRLILLREEMVRQGDARKAIWASSWGWNHLPDSWNGAPSIWGSVTQQQQVDYTVAALNRADREWPWLAGMTIQRWQPSAPLNDPQWGFALIDPDGNPGPLYEALKQRPQPTAASDGLYHPSNTFARYSGVWTFGALGADIGWLQDSHLELSFFGSDVALLLRQDDYVGYLYSTLDGAAANALPRDGLGNAYIVLTSGSRQPETRLVPAARGLHLGDHTLHITADRGWDRWALAGFAVSSGDLATPYHQYVVVAVITAVMAGIALMISARTLNWTALLSLVGQVLKTLDESRQLLLGAASSVILLVGMLLTWGDGAPSLIRRDPAPVIVAILTAGLIYVQPGLIVTIFAALILITLIYHRLDIGLILTLFWAPFFLFPVELYRFAFPMAEISILLTTIAWLLRLWVGWAHGQQSRVSQFPASGMITLLPRLSVLDWGMVCWVMLGCISLAWAEYRPQALTELRVMIIEPALFYAIFRTVRLDRRALVRLVDVLLLGGLAVALLAPFGPVITAEDSIPRLAGVYGSPNNLALFLGRCLPFALAFAILPLGRRRRLFAAGAGVIMLGVIILTLSAGGIFIGVPAAITAVLLLAWGRHAYRILIGLATLSGIALAIGLQSARFARLLDFSPGSTNFFRVRVWQSAVNVIRDHPVTGLGLDQFLYTFRDRYILPDAWQEPNLSHPHNFLLDFWIRLGLLGVALFICLQLAFWRTAWRAYQLYHSRDPLFFAITVGLMGSMVNLIAHGLIDNSVFVQDLAYVFVFLLGLAQAGSNTRAIDEASL